MYTKGKNRLFYQSNNKNQQNVTAEVITPSLEKKGPWLMVFIEEGLYYIDLWFSSYGSHVFYVYENGEKKHRDILVVNDPGFLIYPEIDKII